MLGLRLGLVRCLTRLFGELLFWVSLFYCTACLEVVVYQYAAFEAGCGPGYWHMDGLLPFVLERIYLSLQYPDS